MHLCFTGPGALDVTRKARNYRITGWGGRWRGKKMDEWDFLQVIQDGISLRSSWSPEKNWGWKLSVWVSFLLGKKRDQSSWMPFFPHVRDARSILVGWPSRTRL